MSEESVFLALILVAAFLHASWNAVIKSAPNGLVSIALLNFMAGFFGLLILIVFPLPTIESVPYAILSTLIHTLYCSFLVMSYKVGDLSLIYPIARGSGPVFVALFSGFFIAEFIQTREWLGIIFVSAGIVYMSASNKRLNIGYQPVLLALLTGLCIAAYTIIDGLGSRLSGNPISYNGLITSLFSFPLIAYCYLKKPEETILNLKKYWKSILIAAFMATASYGITLWVMSKMEIALVATLREVSVVFAALIGTMFLKESFGIRRIVGSLIVVGGIYIIQHS